MVEQGCIAQLSATPSSCLVPVDRSTLRCRLALIGTGTESFRLHPAKAEQRSRS